MARKLSRFAAVDNMVFICNFTARHKGKSGKFLTFSKIKVEVEDESLVKAKLKEKYDHITKLEVAKK